MASITIMKGHKNLIFAANVANETGAMFEENGDWITITDSPELTIPSYAFRQAFAPDGRGNQAQLESVWRSLLLNKQGYLVNFDDWRAEQWSGRVGFESLTAFILDAIKSRCDFWELQAND
jgi:hypothetical protein